MANDSHRRMMNRAGAVRPIGLPRSLAEDCQHAVSERISESCRMCVGKEFGFGIDKADTHVSF